MRFEIDGLFFLLKPLQRFGYHLQRNVLWQLGLERQELIVKI